MPSGRSNNLPVSGRGLGDVTPTIFGSTVGYPSDSLASCIITVNVIALLKYRVYCLRATQLRSAISVTSRDARTVG